MREDKTIKLVNDALNAFNSHDIDGFINFYYKDALHYQPTQSEPLKGRAAIKEDYMKATFNAFPDVIFEKLNVFYQNKWVCIEGIFKGTHKGPLLDPEEGEIPPTNKYVEVPICFVVKIEHGKMVEVHEYNDQLGFLTQLGLV
jgi:steroid delta-isomerase-like uncharacterized protein